MQEPLYLRLRRLSHIGDRPLSSCGTRFVSLLQVHFTGPCYGLG
jgi:hypothetical protein